MRTTAADKIWLRHHHDQARQHLTDQLARALGRVPIRQVTGPAGTYLRHFQHLN